jgi:hypothetical protein
MLWRYLGALMLLVFAAPVFAGDDLFADAVAVQHWKLARVRPSGRTYFYQEETQGCPALTARCRRNAYVVHGDLVLIGDVKGALVKATYTNPSGAPTTGWLPRASVELIAMPQQGEAAWIGEWSYDETTIDIDRGGRAGRLKASGSALWGTHDPDRVRRGGVHVGEFEEEAALKGDWIMFGASQPSTADDYVCHVSLRLIGPYLVGADNLNCGGANVSFVGVYRRTSTHPVVEASRPR